MVKILQVLLAKFFNAFLQAFINHLSRNAAPQVIGIVNEVGSLNLSNPEKRMEAFKRISEYFMLTGRAVRDSAINSLIETAVLTLKGGIITK